VSSVNGSPVYGRDGNGRRRRLPVSPSTSATVAVIRSASATVAVIRPHGRRAAHRPLDYSFP